MIEIRIHGRGGQGAVMASHILARAAHYQGYHVQVFPQFGVERRGAPVVAYARMDHAPIRLRTHVYHPHHIMVLDPALMKYVDVTAGLRPEGWIVINSPEPPHRFPFQGPWRVATVDATSIAADYHIGTTTQPIVNTTMVGAFARATGLVSMEHVVRAIAETMPETADANIAAAKKAYEQVQVGTHTSLDAVSMRYARE